MRLVVEALVKSGRCRSTIPGKRDVDDGDAGAHGWRVPAAAADLGVGEAEEAGPGAALEVEGEGARVVRVWRATRQQGCVELQ